MTELDIGTDWIKSEACPPRNGPSQSHAGSITYSEKMMAVAVKGCAYKPGKDDASVQVRTKDELLKIYQARVAGEIQRLRVNIDRQKFVWFVLSTDAGYIQCGTQPPRAIYCEAASAESWSILARLLTPDRVAQLHADGYADPGRSPNYWKSYRLDTTSDAAMAEELLTILHDIYGYDGTAKLEFKTD